MRSMWKGAISFGLVTIPVKLYTATEQRDIAFRQVHVTDGGRIRFRRICEVDGQEVPFADVAKGYELPDGEMVVLTDDDLAKLPLTSLTPSCCRGATTSSPRPPGPGLTCSSGTRWTSRGKWPWPRLRCASGS